MSEYSNLDYCTELSAQAVKRYGLKPGELQAKWRKQPPPIFYSGGELEDAIVDALTMGGIDAWSGNGVSCVAQMIDAQMSRADADKARIRGLETALEFIAAMEGQEGMTDGIFVENALLLIDIILENKP